MQGPGLSLSDFGATFCPICCIFMSFPIEYVRLLEVGISNSEDHYFPTLIVQKMPAASEPGGGECACVFFFFFFNKVWHTKLRRKDASKYSLYYGLLWRGIIFLLTTDLFGLSNIEVKKQW